MGTATIYAKINLRTHWRGNREEAIPPTIL